MMHIIEHRKQDAYMSYIVHLSTPCRNEAHADSDDDFAFCNCLLSGSLNSVQRSFRFPTITNNTNVIADFDTLYPVKYHSIMLSDFKNKLKSISQLEVRRQSLVSDRHEIHKLGRRH